LGTSARQKPLENPDGISTLDALRFMLDVERDNPDAIHVAFAFSYDTEMILKDVPPQKMRTLYKKGVMKGEGYRIEYRKEKWLQVSHTSSLPAAADAEDALSASTVEGTKTVIRVWDV